MTSRNAHFGKCLPSKLGPTRNGGFCPTRLGQLLLMLCLLAIPGITRAEDDAALIRTAVFDYLEGINQLDRERLERAFHEGAALKSVSADGALVVEPIAAAVERWLRGEPGERTGEVLSIDIADGPIARVVFNFDGAFTDYLTLAKIHGQWRIIDKVFVQR